MKLIYFLAMTLLLLTSGCAAITRDLYYTPINAGSDKGWELSLHYRYPVATGKENSIILRSQNVAIEVTHWNVKSKLMSVGPFWFPVVPTFGIPNGYFRPHIRSDNEVTFCFRITFLNDIEIDASRFRLIADDGKEYGPVSYETDSDQPCSPTEIITRGYENSRKEAAEQTIFVHYPVSTDMDSFQLVLSGVKVGKEDITFPAIRFQKTAVFHMF